MSALIRGSWNAARVNYRAAVTGAVQRTQAAKNGDGLSLFDLGGTLTGDNTAAFARAFASNRVVEIPPGYYRTTRATFSNLNNAMLWASAPYATQILFTDTTDGIGWEFDNAQNCVLLGLWFAQQSSTAAITGAKFANGSCQNVIDLCQFTGLGGDGLQLIGTGGSTLSGNSVRRSTFLSCAGKQLNMQYSNDYWVQANQFGINPGGAHPVAGASLQNSHAGTYSDNYHWNNQNAFIGNAVNFARIERNRLEMSDKEGLLVLASDNSIYLGNTIHTNSLASKGAYDNASFTNLTNSLVQDNVSLDWNAGVSGHRYGYSLNTGCANVEWKGNKANLGWQTAPIFVDPSLTAAGINLDGGIAGSSGGTVAPSIAIFLGLCGQNYQFGAVALPMVAKCAVVRFVAEVDTPPGAGQSFTYALYKNGAATGVTMTIAGGSTYQAVMVPAAQLAVDGDSFAVQVTTSSGAAAANHRWSVGTVHV